MKPNDYFALKLTYKRIAIIVFSILFIFTGVTSISLKSDIQQLRLESAKQNGMINSLEYNNSELEDKLNELESRLDDIEGN